MITAPATGVLLDGLQAEVPGFVLHGPGRAMIGARMNHVNYFQGAAAQIRFNDRALAPDEFLKAPGN